MTQHTTPTRPTRRFGAIVAITLLTTIIVPAHASSQGVEPASEDSIYVFGDSFASGEGVGYYVPGSAVPGGNDCHKSLFSFGFRLFSSLNDGVPDAPDAPYLHRFFPACSGATTFDILTQDQEGDGPQLTQVPPVADGARGVSIVALGVNDLGFTPVLTECIFTTSCHTTSQLPQITDPEAQLAALAPRLYEVYSRLLAHEVGTGEMSVYVVGYPQLFSSSTTPICGGALGFEPAERAWINERAVGMNNVLKLVSALLPGVHYVDIDPYFTGHRICDAQPWIAAITIPIVHSFHPNATGHYVTEQLVLRRLRADGF